MTASPTVASLSPRERQLRRHALVERMLTDLVGVPWEAVHHEADRWADEVSDEVEAHLTDVLGDPGTCPHGNPIPGSANIPDQRAAVPLAAATAGPIRVVRIAEEVEEDDEVMRLLAAAGLVPGAEGELLDGVDDVVVVAGARADTMVPLGAASGIWVEAV